MPYLKRFLIILLFLGLRITSVEAQSTLYVKEKLGDQNTYNLNDLRRFSFLNGALQIEKIDGSNFNFALASIRYLSFTEYADNPTDPIATSILNPVFSDIRIYPNPVKSILYIETSELITVDILNSTGQVMMSKIISSNESVDVQNLIQGLYVCRIQNKNNQFIKRFIKE